MSTQQTATWNGSFGNIVHSSPLSGNNGSLRESIQNTSLDNSTIPPIPSDFLDENLRRILMYTLIYGLQLPVTLFGVITNILNIVIFRASGLRDSVTISFIALSISDLMYCAIFFTCDILGLLGDLLDVKARVRLGYLGVGHFMAHFTFVAQDISTVITVFITISKCICVTQPHKFKNFFTRRKTIIILVSLMSVIFISHIPVIECLSFKTVVLKNETVVMMDYGEHYVDRKLFFRWFNKLFLPTFSLLVIVICFYLIRAQLKKCAMLRHRNSSSKLGTKETKILTAVAIVIIIFFVSSLPSTLLAYCILLAYDFFYDPRNVKFRVLLEHAHSLLIQISASVNIFVYFKYHPVYKRTAISLRKRQRVRKPSLPNTENWETI